MTKALRPKTERLLSIQFQIGGSSEVCSGAAARAGASAFARLNRRTQLARTLQKMVSFAAFASLELPFSHSCFELMSCLSTRTWSPLWSASAMDSPRGWTTSTRCQPEMGIKATFALNRWTVGANGYQSTGSST